MFRSPYHYETPEQELEEIYSKSMYQLTGGSLAEWRRTIRNVIAEIKKQVLENGIDYLAEDTGYHLLAAANLGFSDSARTVGIAKREGATETDILSWWNLPYLSREMMLFSEQVFRYSHFLQCRDEGQSKEEAMLSVRRIFPMYDDPDNHEHVHGKDSLFPHELRSRVDCYREAHGAQ